jgi:hypothetical protein
MTPPRAAELHCLDLRDVQKFHLVVEMGQLRWLNALYESFREFRAFWL